jgi:hypothetical protein
MTSIALVSMMVAIAISAVVQILTDPRITKAFVHRSLLVLAVYAAHIAAGFVVIWLLLPKGPDAAVGATMAFLGWVGFGMLGLIRFAPRLREPPRWLMRLGIADLVCLALITGGVASATGLL